MTMEALNRLRKAVNEDPPLTPFVGSGVSVFVTRDADAASWHGFKPEESPEVEGTVIGIYRKKMPG